MPDPAVSPQELAARLAGRLCHDLMGPASGVATAMELLADPSAAGSHADARALAATSARTLVGALTFARAAFGLGGDDFDAKALETLTEGLFTDLRPELRWRVAVPRFGATSGRALLNLVQIAAGTVAAGGVVSVSATAQDKAWVVLVEAKGPRAQLRPEVERGLEGRPLSGGLAGRWVQAFYVHALVTAAGGSLGYRAEEGVIRFTAAGSG
jgi:histidine phosphotransferase ChpT